MKKLTLSLLLALFILVGVNGNARASSIAVDYTVSGTSGNYALDFTLSNNIPASYNQGVYFFGLDIAKDPAVSLPTGWGVWGSGLSWSNAGYGGSSITYTSVFYGGMVASGSSLSGFTIHTAVIPTTIHFYAFANRGSAYNGADAFHTGTNPGFEGVATTAATTAVPEPSTLLMLGSGLAGLGFIRRKFKI